VSPAKIPADARKTMEKALYNYTQTDIFKKYVKDNMLSEAWMDGETFDKWLKKENVRYKQVLTEMGVLKKKKKK
jgi:tripartite-type tricarboxylate transporter receptor subunit TctC